MTRSISSRNGRSTRWLTLAVLALPLLFTMNCAKSEESKEAVGTKTTTKYQLGAFFSGLIAVVDEGKYDTTLFLVDDGLPKNKDCHHEAFLTFTNKDGKIERIRLEGPAKVKVSDAKSTERLPRQRAKGRPKGYEAPTKKPEMRDATWLSSHGSFPKPKLVLKKRADLQAHILAEATFTRATLSTCLPVTHGKQNDKTLSLKPALMELKTKDNKVVTKQSLAALQLLEMEYKGTNGQPGIEVVDGKGKITNHSLKWTCDKKNTECTADVLLSNDPKPTCDGNKMYAEHFGFYYSLYEDEKGNAIKPEQRLIASLAGMASGNATLGDLLPNRCEQLAKAIVGTGVNAAPNAGVQSQSKDELLLTSVPINRVMCPLWG